MNLKFLIILLIFLVSINGISAVTLNESVGNGTAAGNYILNSSLNYTGGVLIEFTGSLDCQNADIKLGNSPGAGNPALAAEGEHEIVVKSPYNFNLTNCGGIHGGRNGVQYNDGSSGWIRNVTSKDNQGFQVRIGTDIFLENVTGFCTPGVATGGCYALGVYENGSITTIGDKNNFSVYVPYKIAVVFWANKTSLLNASFVEAVSGIGIEIGSVSAPGGAILNISNTVFKGETGIRSQWGYLPTLKNNDLTGITPSTIFHVLKGSILTSTNDTFDENKTTTVEDTAKVIVNKYRTLNLKDKEGNILSNVLYEIYENETKIAEGATQSSIENLLLQIYEQTVSGKNYANHTITITLGDSEITASFNATNEEINITFSNLTKKVFNFTANMPSIFEVGSANVRVIPSAAGNTDGLVLYLTSFRQNLSIKKYVNISLPNLSISNATVNMSYSDADISGNNLNESSLRLSRWNETTNSWENLTTQSWILQKGVDEVNNVVWAVVTKLSTFGMVGDAPYTPPPTPAPTSAPSSAPSSVGGGSPPPAPKNLANFIPLFHDDRDTIIICSRKVSSVDCEKAEELRVFLKLYPNMLMNENEIYEKWSYLRHKNMILIGGAYANNLTASVNQNLTHRFINLDGAMKWGLENTTVYENQSLATIELLDSPFAYAGYQRKVLILAGLTRVGTQRAVDYMINEDLKYKDRAEKEFGEKIQILK